MESVSVRGHALWRNLQQESDGLLKENRKGVDISCAVRFLLNLCKARSTSPQ